MRGGWRSSSFLRPYRAGLPWLPGWPPGVVPWGRQTDSFRFSGKPVPAELLVTGPPFHVWKGWTGISIKEIGWFELVQDVLGCAPFSSHPSAFPGSLLLWQELRETTPLAGVGFQSTAREAREGVGLAQEFLAATHHLLDACSQGPRQRQRPLPL